MPKPRFLAAAVLALAAPWALAQSPDANLARNLAATCANCHGITGTSQGAMPSLAGRDATYIVDQMRQFREGKRSATIMHQLSKGYSDEQIAAIAAYFASQKK